MTALSPECIDGHKSHCILYYFSHLEEFMMADNIDLGVTSLFIREVRGSLEVTLSVAPHFSSFKFSVLKRHTSKT